MKLTGIHIEEMVIFGRLLTLGAKVENFRMEPQSETLVPACDITLPDATRQLPYAGLKVGYLLVPDTDGWTLKLLLNDSNKLMYINSYRE